MLSWNGRCGHCGREITNWTDAGFYGNRWLHKACWSELSRSSGAGLPPLRSPVERSSDLELPMFIFLMMFHFGLAAAVAGWLLITRDYASSGALVLAIDIVTPLIGGAGIVLNIISRRRLEVIRQEIDEAGGWKPAV